MQLIGGQIFTPDGFVKRDLCFSGSRIVSDAACGEMLDVSGCYVIPGLTDLHFHGCVGADFSDGDPTGLEKMAEYMLSRGITQICPASITLPMAQLKKVCILAAQYAASESGSWLCGINMEGPFLSEEKKGAQNGDWLRVPDLSMFEELYDISGGLVKMVTVAPELPGAMQFIREASRKAVVSIGHTKADYETAAAAFAAGAREVTHIFNAMPPMNHRDPGVIGAAVDCPCCMAELICDGIHIHPSVIRTIFRMFGTGRIVMISDTMRAAGMPDGKYTLGGLPVTVSGLRAELEDGTLAGSVTDLMRCMQNAVSFGIPLEDAVRAAAVNPAKILGIDDEVGSLEAGKLANLSVLDQSLDLKYVFYQGKPIPVRN